MGVIKINCKSDEISSSFLYEKKRTLSIGDSIGNIRILNLKEKLNTSIIMQIHDLEISRITVMGSKLLSCSLDSKLKVWDLNKWCLINSYLDHRGPINDLDVLERNISTVSDDGDLRFWDTRIKSSIGKISHGFNLTGCRFLNDKNLIVSHGITNFLYLWDLRMTRNFLVQSRILKKSTCSILSSCISKISNFIFILDSQYKIHRLNNRLKKNGSKCKFFKKEIMKEKIFHKNILKLNIDDKGKFILNGDIWGKSFIRSQKNGKILAQFNDHNTPVKEVMINFALKMFISCSIDGLIVLRTF
jgi:WD40 repeat protein